MKGIDCSFQEKKKIMKIGNTERDLWYIEWAKVGLLASTEIGADFYVYFE